jgi:hypothetical protein
MRSQSRQRWCAAWRAYSGCDAIRARTVSGQVLGICVAQYALTTCAHVDPGDGCHAITYASTR